VFQGVGEMIPQVTYPKGASADQLVIWGQVVNSPLVLLFMETTLTLPAAVCQAGHFK
jgi:hypothetical protein